ncbi:ent-copalyl diphosphate synthase AN2, chloroplastic-like [Dioscorea cayenensis subsp. rotundata]|uniref:Ent-copalyl diphosphate synthase AN2, chloroplastic-like n=1 Tax=Dioscorea cayennensis subsp. rotundata TaxID=55577 RepID=A0AB40AR97_DIOCR|nr:ent-copalyl diphosphate synthase AN2, chloroplastic-like [Dioscorea cayenensis subsp. rotundata]
MVPKYTREAHEFLTSEKFELPECNNTSKPNSSEERMGTLIMKIKEKFELMNDGEISPSAYDTAWIARISSLDNPKKPQYPMTLKWIIENQNKDGSWGEPSSFLLYDRLVCTLACVLALKKWEAGEEQYIYIKNPKRDAPLASITSLRLPPSLRAHLLLFSGDRRRLQAFHAPLQPHTSPLPLCPLRPLPSSFRTTLHLRRPSPSPSTLSLHLTRFRHGCRIRCHTSASAFSASFSPVKWLEKDNVRLFSHQIPARKLTDMEGVDFPGECWELDPASLPADLLRLEIGEIKPQNVAE